MRPFLYVFVFLFSVKCFACSAFMCKAKNGVYFAKNFDWQYSHGYIIKNSRGTLKHAYNFKDAEVPSWTSKFGSITFNQIGKEFPYGGMNEAGLVVEQLWNQDNCEYSKFKNSKVISELEWIQYQLDNYPSVEAVLKNLNTLSINPVMAKVHYFVVDASGHSAIIEFINGELKIIENNSNHQLITNSNFKNSEAYWQQHHATVNKTSGSSLDRYCHLTKSVDQLNLDKSITTDAVFKALLPTRTTMTQWSIIYNSTEKEIQFLSRENKSVKTINFEDFDFENKSTTATKINSDNLKFEVYSSENNKDLLNEFKKAFGITYIDYNNMNSHQMLPNQIHKDTLFQNTINLKVNFEVKKGVGKIGVMLVNSKTNYKKRRAIKASIISVENNTAQVMFYSIPKGEYALLAYHDINNNGKLDTNFLGIPKEPFAFSNNAKGFLGLPASYKKAMFKVNADTALNLSIK